MEGKIFYRIFRSFSDRGISEGTASSDKSQCCWWPVCFRKNVNVSCGAIPRLCWALVSSKRIKLVLVLLGWGGLVLGRCVDELLRSSTRLALTVVCCPPFVHYFSLFSVSGNSSGFPYIPSSRPAAVESRLNRLKSDY